MRNISFPKFNWAVYLSLVFIIRIYFLEISWVSFLALCFTLHQFMSLFVFTGYIIPIRYLFGSFMCLQFLLGPCFAYNGLDQYQYFMYRMRIPEQDYFTYAIPAVVAFVIGLHISSGKFKGEVFNERKISDFVDSKPSLPYYLIAIGFSSSVIGSFFSSELGFLFYLVGGLKFVGLFFIIFSRRQLKISALILVFSSIVISSLGEGMFHDLLTWLIMLATVYAIKIKPSDLYKFIALIGFILIALLIQLTKGEYRSALRSGEEGNIDTFQEVYQKSSQKGSLFNYNKIAENNTRINQGFILTNVMYRVPNIVPYENGAEMVQIFQSAIFPRIIYKEKLRAGDKVIFTKYSGINLRTGTSMALGSLSDAYINFGISGGILFMLFLGLFFSFVLNTFSLYSKNFPVLLLFTPLVFYYPIRPDCELQTILGHLIKACFLIWVIHVIWKSTFYKRYTTA